SGQRVRHRLTNLTGQTHDPVDRPLTLDVLGRAVTLVQAVDVLRDDGNELAGLLEISESAVSGVGLRRPDRMLPARLPRPATDLRVRDVVLQRRHPLRLRVASPHSVGPTKVRDSRVGRNTRTGKRRDVLRLPQPL